MWARVLLAVMLFIMPGCLNFDTHLQPINQAVKAVATGEDCSPIIFGFGYGINTVEKAMWKGESYPNPERPQHGEPMPITRIRSVALHEGQFLMFGKRCIKVTGEP